VEEERRGLVLRTMAALVEGGEVSTGLYVYGPNRAAVFMQFSIEISGLDLAGLELPYPFSSEIGLGPYPALKT
jgi:hypothetical protein